MLKAIQQNVQVCQLENPNGNCTRPENWTIDLPGEWRTSNCVDEQCIDTQYWQYGTDGILYANRIIGSDKTKYVYDLELQDDGTVKCYNYDTNVKDYCKMIGSCQGCTL